MSKITNDTIKKAAKKYAKVTNMSETKYGNDVITAEQKAEGIVKLMKKDDITRLANASAYSLKKIKEDFETITENPGAESNNYLRNNLVSKGLGNIKQPGKSNSFMQASGDALKKQQDDASILANNLAMSYDNLFDNDTFGRGAGELANWIEELDEQKPGFSTYVLTDNAANQSIMTAADIYYNEASGESDYVTKQLKNKLYQIWNMYDPNDIDDIDED